MIYIYSLCCPKTGEVRYIGKTKNPKHRLYLHKLRVKGQYDQHRARWVAKLMREGLEPVMKIVAELADDDDWQAEEIRQIAAHRAAGCRLTNMTAGGDGFHDMHPEAIAKAVATRRQTFLNNPELLEAQREKLRRAWQNPRRRVQQSEMRRLVWSTKRDHLIAGMNTPGAKANRSAATKKRFKDRNELAAFTQRMKEVAQRPEVKAQIAAASRKRWADYRAANPPPPPLTDEQLAAKKAATREKQRAAALARCADPEKHARVVGARWTPEKRAAQAAALKARQEKMQASVTTEGRARQAEAMRRIWAERKAATA